MDFTFLLAAYNEEGALPFLFESYKHLWVGTSNKVLFVDDGSSDNTAFVLEELCREHRNIGYIRLSRNFGKEQALAAGLAEIPETENIIVLDSDGQHRPDDVQKLIATIKEYPDVDLVFGVRQDRAYQRFLGRTFSKLYYKTLNSILRVDIDSRLGDFYAARHTVMPALKRFNDSNLFWKGVYNWIGFKRMVVPVEIKDRKAGKSKFSMARKISLAVDGTVWLTKFPLYLITYLGLFVSSLSFLYGIYIIMEWLVNGVTVPGFYTVIIMQVFILGVLMLVLGIIALYIATIYENTSDKPRYLVSPQKSLPLWKEKV